MNVAVLTLTRDRLPYSKHCFQTLRDNAGCEYDHYIFDQASTDGTAEWLLTQEDLDLVGFDENIGICRALNYLLDEVVPLSAYDLIVRFDNDCEVVQPGTLQAVCGAVMEYDAIVGPLVHGLRNPPPSVPIDGTRLRAVHHMGGIFMGIPAKCFTEHGFRYDDRQPPWGGDELICPWWRSKGGLVAYLDGYTVNHYLTTDGQERDDPDYWSRKLSEMAA